MNTWSITKIRFMKKFAKKNFKSFWAVIIGVSKHILNHGSKRGVLFVTMHIGRFYLFFGFMYLSMFGLARGTKSFPGIYRNTTRLQKVRIW